MDADNIKYFLRLRYSREWAFYEEFRPFTGYEGVVDEIDQERGKIKVLVSMFGRETPVNLDFLQIKKI